ncbi:MULTISPECIES: hypothetical protein [Streptomyces]|uniref:Transposase n=1 Tax=Streptomyces virginiae TaxID=1961 RepID=A0ABZ1T5G1_STRVG|nr:hypothetical protein [Streptomyces virginiae]MCX5174189.1 hypothetical protein [Streptomyces virginiae]WTB20212.1 hypothetical protein OG253_01040 [Streptomyces virginiae]
MAKLRTTVANQRAEIEDLRHLVTSLTLASAVLTQGHDASAEPVLAPENVIPFPPFTS